MTFRDVSQDAVTIQLKAQGSITPTVLIGVGGTGQDILLRVRHKFFQRYGDVYHVPNVAYLCLDTDTSWKSPAQDANQTVASQVDFRPAERRVLQVQDPDKVFSHRSQFKQIHEWLEVTPRLRNLGRIVEGAGEIRQASRLAFFENFQSVETALTSAYAAVNGADARNRAAKMGFTLDPGTRFCVVGSLAGGTGSGIALDLGFLLKDLFPSCERLGMFLTYGLFDPGNVNYAVNTYAALKELEHFGPGTPFPYHWAEGRPRDASLSGPAYQPCYLLHNIGFAGTTIQPFQAGNKAAVAEVEGFLDSLAENLFLDFWRGEFADFRRSVRANLLQYRAASYADLADEGGDETSGGLRAVVNDFHFPCLTSSFGLSGFRLPIERLKTCIANRLAGAVVDFWLGKDRSALNDSAVETDARELIDRLVSSFGAATAGERHPFVERLGAVGGVPLGRHFERFCEYELATLVPSAPSSALVWDAIDKEEKKRLQKADAQTRQEVGDLRRSFELNLGRYAEGAESVLQAQMSALISRAGMPHTAAVVNRVLEVLEAKANGRHAGRLETELQAARKARVQFKTQWMHWLDEVFAGRNLKLPGRAAIVWTALGPKLRAAVHDFLEAAAAEAACELAESLLTRLVTSIRTLKEKHFEVLQTRLSRVRPLLQGFEDHASRPYPSRLVEEVEDQGLDPDNLYRLALDAVSAMHGKRLAGVAAAAEGVLVRLVPDRADRTPLALVDKADFQPLPLARDLAGAAWHTVPFGSLTPLAEADVLKALGLHLSDTTTARGRLEQKILASLGWLDHDTGVPAVWNRQGYRLLVGRDGRSPGAAGLHEVLTEITSRIDGRKLAPISPIVSQYNLSAQGDEASRSHEVLFYTEIAGYCLPMVKWVNQAAGRYRSQTGRPATCIADYHLDKNFQGRDVDYGSIRPTAESSDALRAVFLGIALGKLELRSEPQPSGQSVYSWVGDFKVAGGRDKGKPIRVVLADQADHAAMARQLLSDSEAAGCLRQAVDERVDALLEGPREDVLRLREFLMFLQHDRAWYAGFEVRNAQQQPLYRRCPREHLILADLMDRMWHKLTQKGIAIPEAPLAATGSQLVKDQRGHPVFVGR